MQKILTIDCEYNETPLMAAAYLMVEGDQAAFIDNNTTLAVPTLLKALSEEGLTPEQVTYLIITHVHLDHAGGTSALLKACPNATVLAHPRAARHVIDPSRLVASAQSVYGVDAFEKLYGVIEPVPEARVREMEDGEVLTFGNRTLTFIYTRGHANHHFCIHDSASNSVFTGDAFGVHYPALQSAGPFGFPSTSPTDFDGPLAIEAIARLRDLKPDCVYPTHFGPIGDVAQRSAQLITHLEFAEALLHEAIASDAADADLESFIRNRSDVYFQQVLDQAGVEDNKPYWDLMAMDLDLNAQGLAFVANKRRRKAREAAAT
ncbi:MAG: MBL fold metallo-hydrolase [Lysobacterales bacterium]